MSKKSINININTDQSLIAREVPSQRILEISIKAPTVNSQKSRPALNLAIVIDKSGSMSGGKLEYVKQAATFIVDRLQENDQVALVAYDDQVEVLSKSVRMTTGNRAILKSNIAAIRVGGTTNLSGGWLSGCQEVASSAGETTVNRSLLLTDGLANVGIVDLEELSMHARELANRGVTTSTFGVGLGFNEHLLEAMSNQGRGNFYYIETPMGIPDIFMQEFNELSSITASDVEIKLDIPKQVSVEILGDWAHEEKDGKLKIFAGNLFSEQSLEIYLKCMTSPSSELDELTFPLKVIAKDENGQVMESKAEFSFHYADQEAVKAEPRKLDVLERYATVDLADKSTEALKLERAGEREKASRLMENTIMMNSPYMTPEDMDKYQNLSRRVKRGMDEMDRKSTQYDAYREKRRRGEY